MEFVLFVIEREPVKSSATSIGFRSTGGTKFVMTLAFSVEERLSFSRSSSDNVMLSEVKTDAALFALEEDDVEDLETPLEADTYPVLLDEIVEEPVFNFTKYKLLVPEVRPVIFNVEVEESNV